MATLNWKNKRAYVVKTWTENGKQHRKWIPLGTFERKTDGKRAFEEWIRWKGSQDQREKTAIFDEVVQKYLEFSKTEGAHTTYLHETNHSKILLNEFGTLPLHEITSSKIEDLKKKYQWKKTTWRNRLGLLKKILKYADAHGFKTSDPFKTVKIPSPRIYEFPNLAVPIEILDRLIELLPEKYKPFAMIMRYTGLRPSEVRRLRPQDVDFKDKKLQLFKKNQTWKFIFFEDNLIPALKQLPITIKEFTFIQRLRRTCKQNNLPHVTPYMFRHSAGTHLGNHKNLSGGIRTVQEFLDHSTPVMTSRYFRATNEGLREAAKILASSNKDNQIAEKDDSKALLMVIEEFFKGSKKQDELLSSLNDLKVQRIQAKNGA